MLNQLLNLTRPFVIPDTETTGTDVDNDRIVEFGFQVWTAEGLSKEWSTYVDPLIPIPPSASRVHGITNDKFLHCRTCNLTREEHPGADHDFYRWPTFKELGPSLAKGLVDCDFGGKNVRFDLRITAAEMRRNGTEWGYEGARIVDGDRLEALLNPRSLSHLYRKYAGGKLDGAHGAMADVRATTVVIGYQLAMSVQNEDEVGKLLPRDLDALHEAQWPGWIDSEGKFAFVNGVPCFTRWGKNAGRPMKDVDRGYWDWILTGTFSAEVKQLAREAKLGKFPTP